MRPIVSIQTVRCLMCHFPRKTQIQPPARHCYIPPNLVFTPPKRFLSSTARFICSSKSSSGAPPSPPPTDTSFSDDNKRQGQTDGTPRLHMVFTCSVCETRSVKSFSKKAYETGVVIVTCPGCDARHLIADNLGWFGPESESNIEKVLASKGQTVARITDMDIDYTPPSNKPSKH